MSRITTLEGLSALYGEPVASSLTKEAGHIIPQYRPFIERSPFVVIATVGPEGLDCSPRGDPPRFCRVADERTVLIPDRRGNNRIDTLRNLVRNPSLSLLFLIPGVGETLRINGQAEIRTDEGLLASFAMNGKEPRTVLRISVDRIYFQCRKALVRSRLWDPAAQIARSELPSAGEILEVLSKGTIDGTAYEAAYPKRMADTIY